MLKAREIQRLVRLRRQIDAGTVSEETTASKRIIFARWLVSSGRLREWVDVDDGTYDEGFMRF